MSTNPVLLIHGMWSTGETLNELKEAFENAGYSVHNPSLPYHLEATAHTKQSRNKLARTSLSDYVSFLEEYSSQFNNPPILVGHSMGGLLAQILATRINCRSLILISSAPPAGILGWSWSVVKTFGHNLFKFPMWLKTTEIGYPNIRYGIANTQTEDIQRDIASKVTFESGRASFELGLWFLFRKPASFVDEKKIQCPMLIISGLEDRITPPFIQHKLKVKYGQRAKLTLLENTCHWTVGGSNFAKVWDGISDTLTIES